MLRTSVYKACSKSPPAALMHAFCEMTVLLHQLGLVASQTIFVTVEARHFNVGGQIERGEQY